MKTEIKKSIRSEKKLKFKDRFPHYLQLRKSPITPDRQKRVRSTPLSHFGYKGVEVDFIGGVLYF